MRALLTWLCLLLSGSAILSAGTPRTCRILYLSAGSAPPKRMFLSDGKKSREVELPSLNFSKVYELAPGNITLSLIPNPPAAEQPVPAGAPSATVPESITDFYLLVTDDPKNPVAPLKCRMVNADPAGFRVGQMMWFNLTPYEVGGHLGDRSFNVKANSQGIVDAPPGREGSYPVRVGYSPGEGRKPVLFVATEWVSNPTGRNVIFVLTLPNSKVPDIRGFLDIREPREEPKK